MTTTPTPAAAADLPAALESLNNDLIAETERAMRQRDEFQRTGISTASHGGSHDTCFPAILRKHLAALTASAPVASNDVAQAVQCIYLVETGEVRNGVELVERHEQIPAGVSFEVAYKQPEIPASVQALQAGAESYPPKLTRQDFSDRFGFLEGLVTEGTYLRIVEEACAIYGEGAATAALRARGAVPREREYHAALQRVGTALGLVPGSNILTDCVPEIEALRAAAPMSAQAPSDAGLMRFNPIPGLGMNPAKNGLYVRYEDHAAALRAGHAAPPAQQPGADLDNLHGLLYTAQRQPSFDAMLSAVGAARIELSNLRANRPAPVEAFEKAMIDSIHTGTGIVAIHIPIAEAKADVAAAGHGASPKPSWLDGGAEALAMVKEDEASEAERDAARSIELTDDVRFILGFICFQCMHIVQALRLGGREINTKAEDEQAAAIHFMLNHYLADRENWRENVNAELRTMAANGQESRKQ